MRQELLGNIIIKNTEKIEKEDYQQNGKAKFGKPTEKDAVGKLDITNIDVFPEVVRTGRFFYG